MRSSPAAIVPGFYAHLIAEAETHIIEETAGGEGPPSAVGYVSLIERPHDGHSHTTVIELYLTPAYQTRYEDALDLVREARRPTAYLARTDDCRLNATLLARGHQVEPTALVLMPEEEGGPPLSENAGRMEADVGLEPLSTEHLASVKALIESKEGHQGPDAAGVLAELEDLARGGRSWTVVKQGRPVAVIARLDGGDGVHELLDFAVAHAPEEELASALGRAGEFVRRGGRRPAAVIDATDRGRRRIFRMAGYYSAAAYLVFYDAEAGRPSVGAVSLEELREMIARKERFRLVDVLGEDHWREGHLPGSEWIDFKGLARESRRRFEPEEPIVVYCKGFT